ncbi:MAG: hypothetical protein WD070_07630 [Pirellulaceae bacterium]
MTDTPQPNPFTDVNPSHPAQLPNLAVRRPGALTAICIIAIVLGVLGILSGTAKGVNVLFGAEMQQAFGAFGAANNAQQQVQQEMNDALAAEMNRFRLVNAITCVAQLGLCIALVYSGIKTLGLKDAARRLMLGICIALLVYEIGQFVVFMLQQLSIAPIMEVYMPRLMKGPNGEDIGGAKFGQIIARMSIIVGVVTQCVWTLIKLVFYAIAIRTLRKDKIIAYFDPPPTPNLLKPETP